ncbi:hypothetical protein ACH5RR_040223 [Cinchona calisaya]|uniref:Uncharacterized protein n=1 Tax=Cinchona calisaya TaxID=153742 RepID=A0ABD2XSM0_9GENT
MITVLDRFYQSMNTTVTSSQEEVDKILKDFLFDINYKDNVVGIDSKTTLSSNPSTSEKLRRPEILVLYSLGVGMKKKVWELEKHDGLACIHAVELGSLAAEFFDKPYLKFCGLTELLVELNSSLHMEQIVYFLLRGMANYDDDDLVRIIKERKNTELCRDWDTANLSCAQFHIAMVDAYACWKVGKELWDKMLKYTPF